MWLLRLVSLLLDSLYECNITLKYMFLTYYSQNLALWGLFLLCQFFFQNYPFIWELILRLRAYCEFKYC